MVIWFQAQSIRNKIIIVMISIIVFAWLASWMSSIVYDRNCRDFRTHAKAQLFYHLTGGPIFDFHHLDGDSDGIACERLPTDKVKPVFSSDGTTRLETRKKVR